MKITKKEILVDTQGVKIIKFTIQAPDIARKGKAGQFVVAMVKEEGERIPLTIVDTSGDEITLILQEAGLSTKLMGQLKAGDSLYALVGPLGNATHIENYGHVILVAGGVGIAEIYPVARSLKKAGCHVVVIVGARTKDILFYEAELQRVSDKLHVTTDDGSYGKKGFTTDALRELLEKEKPALVYAVGPIPMMEKVSLVTKDFGVKTFVSLNAIMLDASGMCGGCRVTVGGQAKFACVDGPEFDAHLVEWDEMKKRSKTYVTQEKHICNLYKV
jgi:ferredoxin--NADP+ reductase